MEGQGDSVDVAFARHSVGVGEAASSCHFAGNGIVESMTRL